MRAVMDLYLGMVALWLWRALRKQMTALALLSCAFFIIGLASGHILSFILDGLPHWLLVAYAVIEVVLDLIAIGLYKAHTIEEVAPTK